MRTGIILSARGYNLRMEKRCSLNIHRMSKCFTTNYPRSWRPHASHGLHINSGSPWMLCPDRILQVLQSFIFSSEQQSHTEVLWKNQFVYLYLSCKVTHARVQVFAWTHANLFILLSQAPELTFWKTDTAIVKRKMLAYSLLESSKCVSHLRQFSELAPWISQLVTEFLHRSSVKLAVTQVQLTHVPVAKHGANVLPLMYLGMHACPLWERKKGY